MAEHRLTIDIAAPPERVFGLWMDLDRQFPAACSSRGRSS
jgi:hypothetical protein